MKRAFFTAALAAALALPSVAAAQTALPRPEIGEPQPFELPATRTFELDNGIDITFIPFGLAPKANIQVRVRAGNIDDGDQTWIADLTGALIEEGSAGRPTDEIAREAASYGGDLTVGVGIHQTTFSSNVLAEFGPEAVRLLADLIRRPDFPESELARVRQNLIRNVSVARSQPGPVANEAYAELLYGTDHPFGHTLPTTEELESYTMADIRRFYDANYSARRTRIYVSGRFDESAMEAAIREAFGDWPAGTEDEALAITPRPGPVIQMIDRPGAPQSTLRLGFVAVGPDHADYPALTVMNAILGGSFTSRLVSNLREENGYTYSPGSNITTRPGAGGYWTFNADVTSEVTGPALAETFGEIAQLQIEPMPHEEAEGMRTWLSGLFILQNASTGGLIGQVAYRDLYDLPDDYLDTYVPNILAVTDADITRVANEYLNTDEMVLVVVGDLEQVEGQVMALPQLEDVRIAGE
tara:strand:+ start:2113 stop:3522 length:1410 start_codon:yes stop_codon:yes gene_type:complete